MRRCCGSDRSGRGRPGGDRLSLRPVDGGADPAGPGPELRRDERHLTDRGGPDPPDDLRPDRRKEHLARRGGPAADHDAIWRDHDHVGDPDPEIAADLGEPVGRAGVAFGRLSNRLLRGRGPAGERDLVGAGERLEAAPVAAAAPGPVGFDRLVADLAGGPVVALVDTPADGDDAADAGPEGETDHRRCAPPGAEPELREAEGAGVVDERHRESGRRGDGSDLAWPAAREVDEEPDPPAGGVVEPRNPDPDRDDRAPGRSPRPRSPPAAGRPRPRAGRLARASEPSRDRPSSRSRPRARRRPT